MPQKQSLYERLGGADGIARLVDCLYVKVLADKELAPMFAHSPVDRIRAMQCEYIAVAVGGPSTYNGRPIRDVHARLQISPKQFSLFASKLLDALEEQGVSPDDTYDVANRLAKSVNDITGDATYIG